MADIPIDAERVDAESESDGIDPDHPMSYEQCDHLDCSNPTPDRTRLCDDCINIVRHDQFDECPSCGMGLTD